ncbi:hypothetical protein LR48_Vigan01g012300 [Vigna angularis]|uniref:Trichome birefringence-like N-terminal domain-containing protein n=2 Tax=Phaseolus angularis TaxID=3914 RepID=A0A0L9TK95_PHAAN|nr:hypothetical protein LR48_Vigan01g012300 [Vigna angularis]
MNASSAEAPIESVGTATLEKDVEKSATPSTENRTEIHLDTQVVATVDSIPADSPKSQYNQNFTPSSRSTGTPTLEKGGEKSITPTTENGTKLQFDSEGMAAMDSIPAESPKTQYNQNITASSRSKVCNYAKGKWVADSRRPLYSGFNCKQWLSSMWSCRMTQRPDFSFEGYRWQPENCEMQEFNRSAFLRK